MKQFYSSLPLDNEVYLEDKLLGLFKPIQAKNIKQYSLLSSKCHTISHISHHKRLRQEKQVSPILESSYIQQEQVDLNFHDIFDDNLSFSKSEIFSKSSILNVVEQFTNLINTYDEHDDFVLSTSSSQEKIIKQISKKSLVQRNNILMQSKRKQWRK